MDVGQLENFYPEVLKVKSRLETALSEIDFGGSGSDSNATVPVNRQQLLTGLVNSYSRDSDNLKRTFINVKSNLSNAQQLSWSRRLEKLDRDSVLLIASVEKAIGYIARQTERENERKLLLGNPTSARRRKQLTAEALITDERARLQESSAMLDDIIAQGTSTVQNLVGQKSYLQGTGKRMNRILLSLGVSSSILTSIESRLRADKCITYTGIWVVAILTYWVYCWWKGIDPFWWFPSSFVGALAQIMFGKKESRS